MSLHQQERPAAYNEMRQDALIYTQIIYQNR